MDDLDNAATRLFKIEEGLNGAKGSLAVRELVRFLRYHDIGRSERWIAGNENELRSYPEVAAICDEVAALFREWRAK